MFRLFIDWFKTSTRIRPLSTFVDCVDTIRKSHYESSTTFIFLPDFMDSLIVFYRRISQSRIKMPYIVLFRRLKTQITLRV